MSATINRILVRGLFGICIGIGVVATSCSHHLETTAESEAVGTREERQVRLVALFGMIPVVIAFSFTAFIFYRRKREAFFRRTEAELKLSKAEVEIKALKAQINPHFIFNCMNSIHHYMHKQDIKNASAYLIKFSQLIRLVLENSSLKSITLREELQTLELYIQLEQLRLDHKFAYNIDVDPTLDQDACEFAGFLIQPFVENAIWHELTRVKADGVLTISIAKDTASTGLFCTVRSEGKGTAPGQDLPSLTDGIRKTSMGLNLIRERIALLNRTSDVKAYFTTKDVSVPEHDKFGYLVELYIPVAELEP
jgi:sensor histidine kinase YesM